MHGDDFTNLGYKESLDWFRGEISKRYEVKFRARLGPEKGDDKSVRILNRIVSWTSEGIRYEADQRHAEIITKILGLEGKKHIGTPGTKAANEKDEEGDDEPLGKREASTYRAITARGNYMSQDRTDIKICCQGAKQAHGETASEGLEKVDKVWQICIGESKICL